MKTKHLKLTLLTLLCFFSTNFNISFAESTSLEYKVKAVCLFNFAKYVHWPENTFSSQGQPIQVCVLGDSPFGDVFESSDAPTEAQNRPLKVSVLPLTANKEALAQCQLIYWQEKNKEEAEKVMSELSSLPLLTVADNSSPRALISFTLEDGKVRFKIRRKAAEVLGLSISSQLLKLAIIDD